MKDHLGRRRDGCGRFGAGFGARRAVLLLVAAATCLPCCPACARRRVADARDGRRDAALKEVTRAYVSHLRAPPNRPPADEAEFKTILSQGGDAALRRAGVRTVDELLVSPRDSQPFVIGYGRDASRLLDRGIVAHERTGVGGRRLVGYSLGYVDEVDGAELDSSVRQK